MLPAPLLIAPLLQHKGRLLASIIAIALGVALGYAIQLINRAGANEFAQALYALSGDADLTVRGARGGFDESLYPSIAQLPEVAVASPALEVDARLPGRDEPLRVLGLDVFRASRLQPALVGESSERFDTLRSDTVFLSRSAARWLGLGPEAMLTIQVGLDHIELRVAGLLAEEATRQRLGVMDIAAAQWRLHRLGKLTRVDLRLRPGVDVALFQQRLQQTLPPGVHAERPQSTVESNLRLSRAYRVNLNVLALVALFTGALLVFSTQVLATVRRRGEIALLRVLGVTRARISRLLAMQSAVIGAIGAALGVILGQLLAGAAVSVIGADLGAGFFAGAKPQLAVDWGGVAIFFGAGVLAALAGGLLPALEAARTPPAAALRAGDEQRAFRRIQSPRDGLLFVLGGAVMAQLPAMSGLPLFGYASVASLLLGVILLVPWLASRLLPLLPLPRAVPSALAFEQLRASSAQTGVGLAAVVAAVALMTSMAIMVASFRDSLDDWLHRVLPADLYLRSGTGGDTAFLDETAQRAIARLPGIRRVEFLRAQQVVLDPSLPRVTLLARDLDPTRAEATLPLVTPVMHPARGAPPPVWITETAADLYALQTGARVEIPLAGRKTPFTVAGIWRDYARQNGALLIDRALYIELTGDRLATDAGLWLAAGATPGQVEGALEHALPQATRIEVAQPSEIRQLSLSIFDRTFAVTYVLEGCAVVIALFGLSTSVSAQVLARRREFGMLRHIGMTRRQVAAMLAVEGALSSALGLTVGFIPGWLIGLILIHVVNRQSFHWSMELHMPWGRLALFALTMLVLATLTSAMSGRQAMGRDVVRAVREDW